MNFECRGWEHSVYEKFRLIGRPGQIPLLLQFQWLVGAFRNELIR